MSQAKPGSKPLKTKWFDLRRTDPYRYMPVALALTSIGALLSLGFPLPFFLQLILAPIFTVAIDLLINRYRTKKTFFPKSALITGLILGMLLPGGTPLYVVLLAAILAIGQKYVLRYRGSHFFNPAAFGALLIWLIFGTAPGWWGMITPLVLLFFFADYLIRRLPLALTFFLAYMAFAFLYTFPQSLQTFITIDYVTLFFALVMLVEPRTSARRKKGMVLEGLFVAVLAFGLPLVFPVLVEGLIISLLIANILVRFRVFK